MSLLHPALPHRGENPTLRGRWYICGNFEEKSLLRGKRGKDKHSVEKVEGKRQFYENIPKIQRF